MWRYVLAFLVMINQAWAGFEMLQVNGNVSGVQGCPTGFTCDANGWTQFTVGPGGFVEGQTACSGAAANATCIFYVDPAGSDQGCPSSCTANAGNFANPLLNPSTAFALTRSGSPDWVLLKCGGTWTNKTIGVVNKSGLSAGNPLLFSSYDSGASHSPPVPDPVSCSARPLLKYDSTASPSINGISIQGAASFHDIAVVGLQFYAYSRNPFDAGYVQADSSGFMNGITITARITNLLIEDNLVKYTIGGLDFETGARYGQFSSVFIRRNQIFNTYNSVGGLLLGEVSNGPSGAVLYQNIFDHNGWICPSANPCTINGKTVNGNAPSGTVHNLYLTLTGANGDPSPGNLGTPPTVTGNILSNDSSASTLRGTGLITHNLWAHNPQAFSAHQPLASFTSSVAWNVFISGTNTGNSCCVTSAFDVAGRYINEPINAGGGTFTNNILTSNTEVPGASGMVFDNGTNGNVVTGNIIYNWSTGNTTQALLNSTNSGIFAVTITNQGSAYTDLSTSIISAQSSNNSFTSGGCSYTGDGQDYVVLKVTNASNIAYLGQVYTTAGGLSGAYQSVVIDNITGAQCVGGGSNPPQYIILFGSSCAAITCANIVSGTLYYPWYNVSLTKVSCNNASCSGAQADLLSVGGQIKALNIYGSDNSWGGFGGSQTEAFNSAGSLYTVNDTLSATPGSQCSNTTTGPTGHSDCAGGWSFNGSVTTGSGLVITVNSVANNTVSATGCTLASQNDVDPTGANVNGCTRSDPGRSLGSYYAILPGSTPNATFTGVVASGVLTISGISGTVNLGDAITWTTPTQTKQDYIKFNSTSSGTPCNGSACTGTNGNGTYALTGLNTTVGSQSMSSYTAQQFLNLADGQSKQTWNPNYTACKANQYINAGFGVTDPCSP